MLDYFAKFMIPVGIGVVLLVVFSERKRYYGENIKSRKEVAGIICWFLVYCSVVGGALAFVGNLDEFEEKSRNFYKCQQNQVCYSETSTNPGWSNYKP